MMSVIKTVKPNVSRITAFSPPPIPQGISSVVKMDSNECFLGPSPKVIEALKAQTATTNFYPDALGRTIKSSLSKQLSVDSKKITLGNGSNDILDIITRVFVNEGDEVIFSEQAFAVYGLLTAIAGAKPVVAAANDGFGHDLEAMAQCVTSRTRVIFIANPNNPTGTWCDTDAVSTFLASIPNDVVVVLDEAYFEYCQNMELPDGVNLLSEYDNLIVVRTFSKAWGLASLRLGYAISSSAIASNLNKVRQPFNINSMALAAGEAALSDLGYLNDAVVLTLQEKKILEEALEDLAVSYLPSRGNFLAIHVGDGMAAAKFLSDAGIIVTPLTAYGMPAYIRVTVSTRENNILFINTVKNFLN